MISSHIPKRIQPNSKLRTPAVPPTTLEQREDILRPRLANLFDPQQTILRLLHPNRRTSLSQPRRLIDQIHRALRLDARFLGPLAQDVLDRVGAGRKLFALVAE